MPFAPSPTCGFFKAKQSNPGSDYVYCFKEKIITRLDLLSMPLSEGKIVKTFNSIVRCVVDSHIQRIVLAIEETTVTLQVSAIDLSNANPARGHNEVRRSTDQSHHGDSPLLRPTGIHIAAIFLPGPTNQEHRKRSRQLK